MPKKELPPLKERLPHLFDDNGHTLGRWGHSRWIPIIGERVGAYMPNPTGRGEITLFFGYGTYRGNFIPPEVEDFSAGGTFVTGGIEITVEPSSKPYDYSMPKIKLDRGGEVWGNECWWRPAEEFPSGILKERPIKNIGIDAYRAQFEDRYSEN